MTADGPRLVVLVAVDQFPYEYLARFDSVLTGGLRRLLDRGVLLRPRRHRHRTRSRHAGVGPAPLELRDRRELLVRPHQA
jgi:hypothetical protein